MNKISNDYQRNKERLLEQNLPKTVIINKVVKKKHETQEQARYKYRELYSKEKENTVKIDKEIYQNMLKNIA